MDLQKTGSFIAQARKAKGLTQKELAKLIGVTDKAVSRWETGTGFPEVSCLEPLADALEVSVLELLRGEYCEGDTVSVSSVDISMREALHVLNTGVKRGLVKVDTWFRRICAALVILLLLLLCLNLIFGFISRQISDERYLTWDGITGETLYTHQVAEESTMYMIYDHDAQTLHLAMINHTPFFFSRYKQVVLESTFSIPEWKILEYYTENENCNDMMYRVDIFIPQMRAGSFYFEYLILGAAKDQSVLSGFDLMYEKEVDGGIIYCAVTENRPGLDMFFPKK